MGKARLLRVCAQRERNGGGKADNRIGGVNSEFACGEEGVEGVE